MTHMCAVLGLAIFLGMDDAVPKEQAGPISLKGTLLLIGRTQLPIGTLFKAQVEKVGRYIRIVTVDGTALAEPLEFNEKDVDRLPSRDGSVPSEEIWAWESGGMIEANRPNGSDDDQNRLLVFRSRLHLERRVKINDADPPVLSPPGIFVGRLGRDIPIKGTLGEELGTWVEVEGKWTYRGVKAKDGEFGWKFSVSSVRRLSQSNANTELSNDSAAPEFTLVDVKPMGNNVIVEPQEGQVWRLKAYETVAYWGAPESARDLGVFRGREIRSFGYYPGLCWRRLSVSDSTEK